MTITPVTPVKLAELKAQLIAKNQAQIAASPDGSTGQITGHGVVASYHYDAPSQTLSVDVIHHPFYISEEAIEKQLRAALESAN